MVEYIYIEYMAEKGESRMLESEKQTEKTSWKKMIGNRRFRTLILILLIFLNIFVFTKISYLFKPVLIALRIVGPPIIAGAVFYYLFNPVVNWMEEKKINRTLAIVFVFIFFILLIILGGAVLLPIIQKQWISFFENWPSYWDILVREIDSMSRNSLFSEFLERAGQTDIVSTITGYTSQLLNAAVGGLSNVIGTVTKMMVVIFTMPFVAFYLLKDGDHLPRYILPLLPVRSRKKFVEVAKEANNQISQYIRGQLSVALFVGLIFWIGFSVIGLEYALSLGVLAAFLNLIPYLGSMLATIPALIVGLVHSPFMLFKVILVFGIEQLIEGRVISPLILGSNLDIHPVTIIFILLVSGRLFGVAGVILGIPGYAVLKVILKHLFYWYSSYSGLYETETGERKEEPIS